MLAHEIRPAYLDIKQHTDSDYLVTWKIPVLNNRIPKINPIFENTHQMELVSQRENAVSLIQTYNLVLEGEFGGSRLLIYNLEKTLIDVIVRVEFINGESQMLLLQPSSASAVIPPSRSSFQVLKTFGILGVEHIIFGWDHLLFVLGLLLLIQSPKVLIQTITAFTIAHSITLVLSSLGHMSLPAAPVEAVIALSVVFLGYEYVHLCKGKESLTSKRPWLVAFTFGLLHGFGFAGALGEIGLPQHALAESLFSFNVGVEIGQVVFVAGIIGVYKLLLHIGNFRIPEWTKLIPGYFIGGIASFWFIDRFLGILL